MVINETIYTCGEIGNIEDLIALMKKDECYWQYFVYTTKNPKFLLEIGTFGKLKKENKDLTILGIASSKSLAQKIVVHLIAKTISEGKTL